MEYKIREIPLCTECADVVTNPLCPYCFSRHVLLWLRDKNLDDRQVKKILSGLKKFIIEAEESSTEIDCIICNKEQAYLCTYCSIKNTSLIIEKNSNKEIAELFGEDFNHKLWKNRFN